MRRSATVLRATLAWIVVLSISATTVLGESRGEAYRPDDKTPKSRTEIRHEVKTGPDGVRIRISVRQETEGREASSERPEERREQQRPTPPVSVPVPQAPQPVSVPSEVPVE